MVPECDTAILKESVSLGGQCLTAVTIVIIGPVGEM